MTDTEKARIKELLNLAYRWGRDNGEGRSERNFNDFLTTTPIAELFGEEVLPPSYGPCKHPHKYRFTDRDGRVRCADCHAVID